MLTAPIPKLFTSLAVPTVISQMVSVAYNTADTWFVSQISTSASAAVGVSFSVMSIIQAIGFGLGMGTSSIIGVKLGKGDTKSAEEYSSSAFAAATLLGLIIAVLGLIFLSPLMYLVGATETSHPFACDYTRYILIAAPFMCASYVLNNILRSEGESALAMIGLCTGGILNVILDPIFIFTVGLGISGAAIATAISQLISFSILLSMFISRRSFVRLRLSLVSRKFSTYLDIVTSGVPTICRQGLGSLSSAILNIQAAALGGDPGVAAITIAYKVYTFMRQLVLGIGQGFMPIAGYNFGAGNNKRTKKAFEFTCVVGTVVCTVCGIFIALFSKEIMHWFRDDADVISIGSKTLLFCAAVLPMLTYSTVVNQMYQCLGFKGSATFLASCRQGICFIPIVVLMPLLIGFTGVEIAQPGADLLTFIISVPFQISFYRKHLKD